MSFSSSRSFSCAAAASAAVASQLAARAHAESRAASAAWRCASKAACASVKARCRASAAAASPARDDSAAICSSYPVRDTYENNFERQCAAKLLEHSGSIAGRLLHIVKLGGRQRIHCIARLAKRLPSLKRPPALPPPSATADLRWGFLRWGLGHAEVLRSTASKGEILIIVRTICMTALRRSAIC